MAPPLPLAAAVAFAAGSVPFGWLLARALFGRDIRREGSQNIGATNAARAAPPGWRLPFFALVWALDAAKGFLPVFWVLGGRVGAAGPDLSGAVVTAVSAVLGHCFTPWFGFRGGKGVATTTGVLLALDPKAFAAGLFTFAVVFGATRIVALASIALGFGLLAGVVLRAPEAALAARWPLTAACAFLAVFIVWTHRSNLRELAGGRGEKT